MRPRTRSGAMVSLAATKHDGRCDVCLRTGTHKPGFPVRIRAGRLGAVRVSVLVPTRERPDELRRLLRSLSATRFRRLDPEDQFVDVVIVDNARPAHGYDANELTGLCGFPVRVVHEPRTGIPFARNTAIRHRAPDADVVVFTDDDMAATPSWLEQLLLAAERYSADFVSGPYLSRVPDSASERSRFLLQALRNERPVDGTALSAAATGNLLITVAWLERQETWLDERFGTSGGSDIEWTARLVREGATIVHADRAVSWHWLSEERTTLRWLGLRAYRVGYGQGERTLAAGRGRGQVLRRAAQEFTRAATSVIRHAVRRETEPRYAAEVSLAKIAGWAAAAAGLPRPRVYRHVTSERASRA